MGSAIDTPAPGRASAPPGQRGRISARKACCAGTQNTTHTVTSPPCAPGSPLQPPRCRTHIRASGGVNSSRARGHVPNWEARDVVGNLPSAALRHGRCPPVSIPSLPALLGSSWAAPSVHCLALSPPWDQCGTKSRSEKAMPF